jgi:hypothetical protein
LNGTELGQWVQALIERGEPESASLDFKQRLPDDSHKGRKSYLHDVTALANTWGGRIIYGVAEERSCAISITPLPGDPDTQINRLLDMAASGVEPRLAGLRITHTDVQGGYVLVVEVPQQFDGPFRAQLEGHAWFKCRAGQVNRDMDYNQLKNAFGERSRMFDRLRSWREGRIERHRELAPRQRIADSAWAVLHVLPLASFAEQFSFDLKRIAERGFTFRRDLPGTKRFNSDGLQFVVTNPDEPPREYAQFFRRGMIEVAWTCRRTDETSQRQAVMATTSAMNVFWGLKRAGEILEREGMTSSVVVALSILNVANHRLAYDGPDFPRHESVEQFDDAVAYPEKFVERTADLNGTTGLIAKSVLDELWQTFDMSECLYFDDTGNWTNPQHQL